MSTELNPVGVACTLRCTYCYENPMRDAGNLSPGYDLEAMKQTLASEGQRFTLFGGEPLMMKFDDLAEVLRFGFERHGGSGMQTNGMLITPAHVELFRRYACSVGISVDGPEELNDSRWAGSLDATRAATKASFHGIELLFNGGIVPSFIITLYRGNATGPRLDRLCDWILDLDRRGVRHVRIHLMEVDHQDVRDRLAMTEDENIAALDRLAALQDNMRIRFDLFTDMETLLLGKSGASCVWNACDPLTTPAVRAINGLGGLSNCTRTNKDGVDWVKTASHGNERYLVLYHTPQADGGCQGCRFFFACKGQCPGTAIDGDWRNRSEQCRIWYRALEATERRIVAAGGQPISLDSARRLTAEAKVLEPAVGSHEHGDGHGDHWDAPDGYQHGDGGFDVHGDAGITVTHGDVPHGDHTDA